MRRPGVGECAHDPAPHTCRSGVPPPHFSQRHAHLAGALRQLRGQGQVLLLPPAAAAAAGGGCCSLLFVLGERGVQGRELSLRGRLLPQDDLPRLGQALQRGGEQGLLIQPAALAPGVLLALLAVGGGQGTAAHRRRRGRESGALHGALHQPAAACGAAPDQRACRWHC